MHSCRPDPTPFRCSLGARGMTSSGGKMRQSTILNIGSPGRAARTAIALLLAVSSCTDPTTTPAPPSDAPPLASTKEAFETDGLLGQKEVVLVQAMVESDTRVSLRARQAGVEPSSLQAKAYGVKIYVLHKDPEMGTAFMHRTQVYHLGSRRDQLTVDETYFYCTGFLSADIIKVTEKSWSKYYASDEADITRLDTLAEAVRSGVGHQDAFKALDPVGGGMLRNGGNEQNRFERDVTWFAGRQAIEGVGIELTRSRDAGNRVSVRFLQ